VPDDATPRDDATPPDDATPRDDRPDDGTDGVPIDDELNATDEPYEAPIERFHQGALGEVASAAMTGFAKALGWGGPPKEAPVIREAGAPPRDPDDPIEISIDHDHPENTRIVFHVRAREHGAGDG
jgi:hypothetical protein